MGLVVAKAAVSLALAIWLLRSIELDRLQRSISDLGAAQLAAALSLFALQAALSSLRWCAVLKICRGSLGFWIALRWVFVGLFFNQALPTSVGGDAVRIWLLRRSGSAAAETAFASVAIERVTGIAILGSMVSACVTSYGAELPRPVYLSLAGAGPLLLLILVLLAVGDRLVLRRLAAKSSGGRAELARGLRAIARSPSAFWAVVVTGFASSLCGFGAAYVLGHGLGVDIAFSGVVVALGGSMLISVLPISIGGWGVRDASLVSLYAALGAARENALAVSLLWGLMQLFVALPGGLLWWWDGRTRANGRVERSGHVEAEA